MVLRRHWSPCCLHPSKLRISHENYRGALIRGSGQGDDFRDLRQRTAIHTYFEGACIRRAGGQFAMIDLADQRFGRLVALRACDYRKDGRMRWLCICDCGRKLEVGGNCLRSGHTKSCGCLRFVDIAAQRFGRLTAVKRVGKSKLGGMWKCQCDCGGESVVACSTLRKWNH